MVITCDYYISTIYLLWIYIYIHQGTQWNIGPINNQSSPSAELLRFKMVAIFGMFIIELQSQNF